MPPGTIMPASQRKSRKPFILTRKPERHGPALRRRGLPPPVRSAHEFFANERDRSAGTGPGFCSSGKQEVRVASGSATLRAQDRDEAAAAKLAQAARVEETLSERCLAVGLREKAWLHRFSAASCWAQAGNFYQAIAWCDDLLSQPDLLARSAPACRIYARQFLARRAQ